MAVMDKETQFTAAVEQHRDALYRVCCAYAREDTDRQDIYQELLVNIWKSLDGFRGQSKLGTWLYRVAVNTCLGWLRREKRRFQMLERAAQDLNRAAAAPGPAACSIANDDTRQLYRCIAQLAPVDRLLVSLHLEDLDSAEIAAVLGISEGNVRVKLHRIRNQLQELWEKEN
jgi:RNA polymerase sigma-70 factor (ECF subfamily)